MSTSVATLMEVSFAHAEKALCCEILSNVSTQLTWSQGSSNHPTTTAPPPTHGDGLFCCQWRLPLALDFHDFGRRRMRIHDKICGQEA